MKKGDPKVVKTRKSFMGGICKTRPVTTTTTSIAVHMTISKVSSPQRKPPQNILMDHQKPAQIFPANNQGKPQSSKPVGPNVIVREPTRYECKRLKCAPLCAARIGCGWNSKRRKCKKGGKTSAIELAKFPCS